MTDIKLYTKNPQKTFEEIGLRCARSTASTKCFYISKRFYDWLQNEETKKTVESLIAHYIAQAITKLTDCGSDVAAMVHTKHDDWGFLLYVTFADIDDEEKKFEQIIKLKNKR